MRMRFRNIARPVVLLASVSLLMLASSGCGFFASVPTSRATPLPNKQDGPSYTVEYHSEHGRSWQKKFPLTGSTHVSGALRQANAMKKLDDMNVSVLRNVKDTNRLVAMTVTRKGKGVSPNTDYAIYDGDRVVIKEDNTSPLDGLLDKVMPGSH